MRCRRLALRAFLLGLAFAAWSGFAAVIVPAGSVWKYLDDGSNQSNAWQTIDYEDDGWEAGPAELGYGDGDEATVVSFGPSSTNKYVTTYFRHVFELADTSPITNVLVRLLRDDGGIVYLNGVEIFRSNMSDGPVNYLTLASSSTTNSSAFLSTNVSPSLLVAGRNLLAVEIHQSSRGSSDISFDLDLLAAGASEPPTVAITQPANNTLFAAPTNVLITASASDPDGTVARVEFFQGNFKLGEITNAPFNFLWTNAQAGAYTLFAIATDDTGLLSKSLGAKLLIGSGVSSNLVLLPAGSTWRYFDAGQEPASGWREPGFDDSSWKSGAAQLGYGDGDEVTQASFGPNSNNKFITTYFRTTFVLGDTSTVPTLVIKLLRDDGGIIYLNGEEALRSNMPLGIASNSTLAVATLGTPEEATFVRAVAGRRFLINGTNVIAAEIHQASTNSSDMSFDLELLGTDLPSVVRCPYLQSGTPGSLIVKWRTDATSNSRVRYGSDPSGLNFAADNAAITTEHQVTLSGLVPDTTYFYSVGSSTAVLASGADYKFTTAPVTGAPNPTRIWVIGDSGTANVDAQNVRDAFYRFAADRPADLWLMLGDNAYNDGDDDEYQAAVFDTYPTLLRNTVLWPTIGNHDTDESATPAPDIPYYQIFSLPVNGEAGGAASGTEDYYSFDYANIHFVCLDAMTSARTAGSPMLTWLQNDLASTTQEWVIAFWHHPPYSKGSHDSDTSTRQTEIRQNIVPVLESNGVDLVLCGHSHAYERSYLIHGHYGLSTTFDNSMMRDLGSGREETTGLYNKPTGAAGEGAVYIVAGSSGKISGGTLNHPAMFISHNRLGSLVLDINEHRLDAKFIRETGAINDYFTIIKGPLAPTLTIERSVAADVLRWSTNYGDAFSLEAATELASPTWNAIPSQPIVLGNQFVVTNSAHQSRMFYRLRR